jgi:hypothetical protein
MTDHEVTLALPGRDTTVHPRYVNLDETRAALRDARAVIAEIVVGLGDRPAVSRFVTAASAWCRGVESELALLEHLENGFVPACDLERAGMRCARRYAKTVGDALCMTLLAPGASSDLETWQAVDRGRAALVGLLDVLLRRPHRGGGRR